MRSNHQIAAACPIDADTYVLEVGCGAGATASYLAQGMAAG